MSTDFIKTDGTSVILRSNKGIDVMINTLAFSWLVSGETKTGVTHTLMLLAANYKKLYGEGATIFVCSPEGNMRDLTATGEFVSYNDTVACLRHVENITNSRAALHSQFKPTFVFLDDISLALHHPTAVDLLIGLLKKQKENNVHFILGSHELYIGTAAYRGVVDRIEVKVSIHNTSDRKCSLYIVSKGTVDTIEIPEISTESIIELLYKEDK